MKPSLRTPHGQAVATVGEREREIAQHPPGIVPRAALAHTRERALKARRQPDPIGESRHERGARARGQTVRVRNDL